MQGNSRLVSSNQRGLHPNLTVVVRRHLLHAHQAVVSAHSRQAYHILSSELAENSRPLVLDSFCGTGHSTAALAERHPAHLVVGIDKSASRLAKHTGGPSGNYLLLQAHCEDIWKLLLLDGLRAHYHYLLYPNPWPKAGHLQRRIHGHASFPTLLGLGGRLELRSNWQVYIEEFDVAMLLAGYRGSISKLPRGGSDLSLFERKYRQSGHDLWSYTAQILP